MSELTIRTFLAGDPHKRTFHRLLARDLLKLEQLTCHLEWLLVEACGDDVIVPHLTSLTLLGSWRTGFGPMGAELPCMPRLTTLTVDDCVDWLWLAQNMHGMPKLTTLRGSMFLSDMVDRGVKIASSLQTMEIAGGYYPLGDDRRTEVRGVVSYLMHLRDMSYVDHDANALLPRELAALAQITGLQSLKLRAREEEEVDYDAEIVALRNCDARPRTLRTLRVKTAHPLLFQNAIQLALSNAATLTELHLSTIEQYLLRELNDLFDKQAVFANLRSLSLRGVYLTPNSLPPSMWTYYARHAFPCLQELRLYLVASGLTDLIHLSTLRQLSIVAGPRTLRRQLKSLHRSATRESLQELDLRLRRRTEHTDDLYWAKPSVNQSWRAFLLAPQHFQNLRHVRFTLAYGVHSVVICALLHAAPILRELHIMAKIEDWGSKYYAVLGAIYSHQELDFVVLLEYDMADSPHYNEGNLVHTYPRTLFVGQSSTVFVKRFLDPNYTTPKDGPPSMTVCRFPFLHQSALSRHFYDRAMLLCSTRETAEKAARGAHKFLTREHLDGFFDKLFHHRNEERAQ
jgi:hypothetical protein